MEPRYPKRKREAVKYQDDHYDDSDEDRHIQSEQEGDDDWSLTKDEPAKKSAPKRARVTRRVKTPFRFPDLPRELRDMVYENAFGHKHEVLHIGEISSQELGRTQPVLWAYGKGADDLSMRARKRNLKTRPINVSLLQSCRKVQDEGMKILYGHQLKFRSVTALQNFLVQLRPTTINRLRHIELGQKLSPLPRQYLPAAFALLAPAVDLAFLRVPSVAFRDGQPDLNHNLGPAPRNDTMSIADWDVLVGRNMVKETYKQMFPFLQSFFRSKAHKQPLEETEEEPVERLLGVLRVFEKALQDGPRPHLPRHVKFDQRTMETSNEDIAKAQWTSERRSAVWKAMGTEIAWLVQLGSI